jgi:hypothetical protein
VLSLIDVFLVATFLRYALQRFQVGVSPDGWTVRIGRYRRDVRWAEISAVVIEDRVIPGRGHQARSSSVRYTTASNPNN